MSLYACLIDSCYFCILGECPLNISIIPTSYSALGCLPTYKLISVCYIIWISFFISFWSFTNSNLFCRVYKVIFNFLILSLFCRNKLNFYIACWFIISISILIFFWNYIIKLFEAKGIFFILSNLLSFKCIIPSTAFFSISFIWIFNNIISCVC